MNSERIVTLTILTSCIYGFSQFMQQGTWIFPFPLYEIGLLVAVIGIFITEKKRLQLTDYLALGWIIVAVISTPFVLEIAFGEQQLERYFDGALLDILSLFSAILLLFWGVLNAVQSKLAIHQIIGVGGTMAFCSLFILNHFYLAIIPLSVWLIATLINKQSPLKVKCILGLYFFFYVSKYATLGLLG